MSRATTAMPESQVERIATDNLADAFKRLPYDEQSPDDTLLAEHYLLKAFNSIVHSRLERLEKVIKEEVKAGRTAPEKLTRNYKRMAEFGTPRAMFDYHIFIDLIVAKYKNIPKHTLVELAQGQACFKQSAVPMSFTIDYIGDVSREIK